MVRDAERADWKFCAEWEFDQLQFFPRRRGVGLEGRRSEVGQSSRERSLMWCWRRMGRRYGRDRVQIRLGEVWGVRNGMGPYKLKIVAALKTVVVPLRFELKDIELP